MEFTGERFVPEVHGNIELEHMHRYLQACEIADGKMVLDIASGEGYGSAMLAEKADKVTGVDISIDAVKHARKRYKKENLDFMVGSCVDIPLPDASVDLVISFETIEHLAEHTKMMQEIKRVLRPNGILLISSPDKYNYSEEPGYSNSFHVKELYLHEFKQLLGNYFKHTAYFGQRIVYGSNILSEGSPAPVLSYLQEEKRIITTPGVVRPIYSIALASDGPLPEIASSVLEQHINESEIIRNWSKLVAEREQSVQALTLQVAEREQTVQALSAQINEIVTSKTWKIALRFRQIRVLLAPLNSRRERWLRRGMRATFYLKRYGLRSLIHKTMEKLKHTGVPSDVNNPIPDIFTIKVHDGKPCPMPTISVVIEKNHDLDPPYVRDADVLVWVSEQTLRGVEVVVWESDTGIAITPGEPVRTWEAPGLGKLCQGLTGRYLCMASPDLILRNHTYLETNLIALESEGLAFTVNSFGKSDWLLDALRSSHLPGNRRMPYLRQVIRINCVRNDFSLDISSCMIEQPDGPVVAGKIIVHTTAFPDTEHPFSAETLLTGTAEWNLKKNYILARNNAQIPWEPLVLTVHPVNTVIPMQPEPSNLPTILIFMPFLAVGGAERLVLQLIRHLQEQARFVLVTVEGMDASLGTTADAFHQTIPFIYTAADFLLPPLNFSFLSYLIERFQVDTFYIANGSNWIYDALGTLRKHYPELRIVDQVYDHQFGWINRYDLPVVTAIDAFISANPNITQAYTGHGARPEQIYFVEHAVNMDDVNPADYPIERCAQIKQTLGLPVEKKLVTFCARLHPQKRPLDFIELVRRFASEEYIHFLMVGDGPLATAVEEQVVRTGLRNFTRCKFYTPISDIYAITDVLVLPSEYEAMPLVILETLAMGKTVVATDVGHIRDVVEMAHAGVVVPNIGDVIALRMGVLQALTEPVDSAAMRQAIEQRFGISHIAKQYLQVWSGESHG